MDMNIVVSPEGENGMQVEAISKYSQAVIETMKQMSLPGRAHGMRRKPKMKASLHLDFFVEKMKGLHQHLKNEWQEQKVRET